MKEIMAGKHGRKKPTQKKSGNSTRARENVAPVVEEHEIKGRKRKNPSSISSGVSTRTRARKAVSDGNEPVGEDVVHEESTRVREKTEFSLSLDSESEDMSVAEQEAEEEQKAEQEAEEEQGIEVQEKQQPRKDGEKEAEEEQEKEVQDGEKEAEKEPKETPTPPRGRTKAAAARKLVHTPPEKFFSLRDPMRKRNSQG
ncbi:BnaCnng34950D [Brassica napus]|uniref:(rape) hypothetical protein n=1 Tax=Brassica napus TaxID=3708 RepID=A0A078J1M1_BRANA|nr:unnamed protein product [Brassica napus]CDY59462.1 BnaCnng34950D [Brassica napus]